MGRRQEASGGRVDGQSPRSVKGGHIIAVFRNSQTGRKKYIFFEHQRFKRVYTRRTNTTDDIFLGQGLMPCSYRIWLYFADVASHPHIFERPKHTPVQRYQLVVGVRWEAQQQNTIFLSKV